MYPPCFVMPIFGIRVGVHHHVGSFCVPTASLSGGKERQGLYMRKYERFLSTSFYLRNLEKHNNKYYALKSTIDEIGRIGAHKEDFSLLKRETMTSRASTERGKSIVYKYSDRYGVKFLIHEVTDENNRIIQEKANKAGISMSEYIRTIWNCWQNYNHNSFACNTNFNTIWIKFRILITSIVTKIRIMLLIKPIWNAFWISRLI